MAPRGRRGARPRRNEDRRQPQADRRPRESLCRNFQNGYCSYGDMRRFFHDLDCAGTANPATTDADATKLLSQLKTVLRTDALKYIRPPEAMRASSKLWSIALAILDSEYQDRHQELAKILVDDNYYGHQYIIATVRHLSDELETMTRCIALFVKVITHNSLLTSAAIESYTTTIYTRFGGSNGEHGIKLLHRMCIQLLVSLIYSDSSPSSGAYERVLSIVKACRELLCRVPRTRLCDILPVLLTCLDKLVTKIEGKFSGASLDVLHSHLNLLKIAEANQHDLRNVSPSVPVPVGYPYGRQDNDFADISNIVILPTIDEIVQDHAVHIPSNTYLHPHARKDPLQRYIDSTLKLFRHVTMGPVSDVLRDLISSGDPLAGRLSRQGLRANTYLGCRVQHIFLNDRQGLQAVVSFRTLPWMSKWPLEEQETWWEESPRLEEGRLLCFISSEAGRPDLLFLQVAEKRMGEVINNHGARNPTHSSLVSHANLPSITVKLAARQRDSIMQLARLFADGTSGVLVDFNGVIPETYVPTFESLRRIQRENHIPLHRWMLPTGSRNDHIPPPLYAREEGFVFPLSWIADNEDTDLQLDPAKGFNGTDLAELEALTGLDSIQCHGLVAALTREYALIQGPPGTGKSYLGVQLMKVLLSVRGDAELGPIVVSCYTDHALDQFLKQLVDVGIDGIIRIGSRSTVPELHSRNLRVVRNGYNQTPLEEINLEKAYDGIGNATEKGAKAIRDLHQSLTGTYESGLGRFISKTRPNIHRQLVLNHVNGFRASFADCLVAWLGETPSTVELAKGNIEELTRRAEQNIHLLSAAERRALADHWAEMLRESQADIAFEALADSERHCKDAREIHEVIDQLVLVRAKVIGVNIMTAAQSIELLRSVSPKVMICMEAAEVMEPRLISALVPGIEHLIQIGDHRQLRPHINNYRGGLESDSGQKWQLDRSQFERRAVGEPELPPIPVTQLNVQRRMRPEFSKLVGSAYPDLQDHSSVMDYPSVVGMRHDLFWLDHDHIEDTAKDPFHVSSYSNRWETNMAMALVRHLILQGNYQLGDIALLTPYADQLRQLTLALSKEFVVCPTETDTKDSVHGGEGAEDLTAHRALEKRCLAETLRLATVDNFQGEEAKVVVVSLVRSNPQGEVGFLRSENHINVLLSRAKHGMYLIGNASTYLHVPMWADVHKQLSDTAAVKKEIELCCPRHPDTSILCSEPEHFATKSPAGGCALPCPWRLESCGHKCPEVCHTEAMHDAVSCQRPCPRIRSTCDHECAKLCEESCGPCMVQVHDVELPCGHIEKSLLCYQTLDLSSIECKVEVQKTVPYCSHDTLAECAHEITVEDFRCPLPCSQILPCGHRCTQICGECFTSSGFILHQACTKVCDRQFSSCNHRCAQECHDGRSCGVCQQRCEVRCPHSACRSQCNKACTPCIEQCTWACPHQGSCSMPCSAPCDRLPCDKRCDKILVCGHQCPSFCGEECPDSHCQECGDKGEARVDLLEFRSYNEVDLDESPIVVLGCGHFFTGETLDGLVGLGEVYLKDEKDQFVGLKDVSFSLSSNMPFCPGCRQPIRQYATKRYNRLINRAVMDETYRRLLVKELEELNQLEQKLRNTENELATTRALFARTIWKTRATALSRRSELLALRTTAERVKTQMKQYRQPTKVLVDAIAMSRARHVGDSLSLTREMESLKLSQYAPIEQMTLRARLIDIKAQEVQLLDGFALIMITNLTPGYLDIDDWLRAESLPSVAQFLDNCNAFSNQAREANLPRLAIAVSLSFATITRLLHWNIELLAGWNGHITYNHPDVYTLEERTGSAHELLHVAWDLCLQIGSNEELKLKVLEAMEFFDPRHEDMTPEELASIRSAMVDGSMGMATNSGHWYNCANGHPFAVGDCGMPTEVARCPECGAHIGGINHQPVDGVTRAEEMEHD